MAALPQGEELDGSVAPPNDFDPIETGNYNVVMKTSNGGPKEDGRYVVGMQFQVIDGPSENRTFWLNFNFTNPKSQMNQDISRKQITQIANAAGIGIFADTDALLAIPINMSVKLKADPGYAPRNEMTTVKPYDASVAAAPPARPAARAAAPAAPARAGAPAHAGAPARAWAPKK